MQKRPLSRRFAINLKNVGPIFFQDYPNAILFNLVRLCPSILLFPFAILFLCRLTVLNINCNVSFYFLGILDVMKLHHFSCHHPFKLACWCKAWTCSETTSQIALHCQHSCKTACDVMSGIDPGLSPPGPWDDRLPILLGWD